MEKMSPWGTKWEERRVSKSNANVVLFSEKKKPLRKGHRRARKHTHKHTHEKVSVLLQ
jgi:hypothetical protein